MRRQGLSLVEVLATLFLFSIVLGVISQLLVSYQRVEKFSAGKDRSIQAALVTLGELREETKEATAVVVPASSSTAVTLEVTKVIPGSSRFPEPVPLVPPGGWTLFPASTLVTLRYRTLNGQLTREIVSGLPAATYTVSDGVSDLQTRLLAGGNVEISFVVAEQTQSRTLLTSVHRRR